MAPMAVLYSWRVSPSSVTASEEDELGIGNGRTSLDATHIIPVMDDQEFRRLSDEALERLKRSLYEAEGEADFEVEFNAGALHISFEEPPGKFVISPNAPVRQIWISALSTSFKLDWSEDRKEFVLLKSGEGLKNLVARLISEQLGGKSITLS